MHPRIPPIQCLITFEILANLRSVTKTANFLCVSPSTVTQRIRLLESIVQKELFYGRDFSLNQVGNAYLDVVSQSLNLLRTHSFDELKNSTYVVSTVVRSPTDLC